MTRSASAVDLDPAGNSMSEPPVRILVVCTANICRSPVVEALLRDKLAHRGHAWQVASGGLLSTAGHPASKNSVIVLAARGVDIADHTSHEVQCRDVEAADLVLCMEQRHVEALRVENREHRTKIHLLTAMIGRDEDIADPYGGPLPWYETMVADVDDILDQGLDRIIQLASEVNQTRAQDATNLEGSE